MSKHLVQKEKKQKQKYESFENQIDEFDFEDEEDEAERVIKLSRPKTLNPVASILISALLLFAVPFCPFDSWMLMAAYGVVFLLAALEFIWNVLENCQSRNFFDAENILLLAAILAFALGFYFESVLLLLLYKISKLIYQNAEKGCWENIKNFSAIESEFANVETAEGILRVGCDYVNVGDIIYVEPGEIIPLDGVVLEGISTIDTEALSGQSTPWAVNEGYRVFSGCRNLTSPLKLRVTKGFEQSTAHSMIELVKSSTLYGANQEKLTVRIKRYYCLALLAAGIIITVVSSLINGNWLGNAENAVIMLTAVATVASVSYAGLGYIKSIGIAAGIGVFVKGADCIESMAKSETVVFDKTGIITEGRYIITDVFSNKVSEQELLRMAATAERFSRHPVAVALREAAGSINVDSKSLKIEELPGRGISAFVEDKQVYVGNTALLEEHGIKCAVPVRPGAAIHVAVDGKYWGHILVTDRIRRGAFDALENLRAQGIKKLVLLTGDVLSVAKPLASKLNFDMLRAELRPEEKVSAVDYLMSNRGDSSALAFIGDGSSDSQIMSRVDVGIALGALGSDAAFNYADVLIMDRDIKKLPAAFRLSKSAYRVNLLGIIAWCVVNMLLVILSILGLVPLIIAIVVEFLLSLGMYINFQRIK